MADGKEAASQEPTDIVVEDELAKDTDLGTNSQSVSLQRSQSMPSMVSLHQGQLKAKMRLRAELKGCRGPKVRMRKTLQSSWDERHHLNGSENEAKPKMLRDYFSKPESLPELKQTLTQMPNVKSVLAKLEADEVPPCQPSFVSADHGVAVCPTRHIKGGHMLDRDGDLITWNDRWHAGLHLVNDGLHPKHRAGFASKSLFETSPSQRWRRHEDVELAHGVWRPIQVRKAERFPPLGV
eukprot:TRINITY_DN11870_c0_g1_i8.p1 TRINITY_DN11870_c0_g1~~TRINITY_DN11870_c0_g1_i8.p1  ORF type:complete len:238 (+),score=35.18 TRINITY_DN11870_c0_g1_i8:149-862(+)